MRIIEKPIDYFVGMLHRGERFSLANYSDGEWFCMIGHRIGLLTGGGQMIDSATGERMIAVLKRRQHDPSFLFSTAKVVLEMVDANEVSIETRIDTLLAENDIRVDFYERDMISDDLAAASGLFPFIKELRRHNLVFIGNRELEPVREVLYGFGKFIGIDSPNLHMLNGAIEDAVEEAVNYGQPAVYLVSAGLSAPLIVDQLHDRIPGNSFIDCGSIWDAFVGIGGQRDWRKEMYKDPAKVDEWRRVNQGL